jgi:dihydrofolate synthase/folylpolyglutamate synthase
MAGLAARREFVDPPAIAAGALPPMILEKLLDLEKTPAARPYSETGYNLDAFRAFVESLGSPQRGLAFLHVAGTKGKGSTCAIGEGLLRGMGFPTALYSSPHLEHFGERLRFDGVALRPEEFEARLQAMYDGLDPAQRAGFDGPHPWRTVFEVLTALALVECRDRAQSLRSTNPAAPPLAICWETGLGGRLDCTNIVDPIVSVITTLGMDHVKILGGTIEAIAREKAGIIKPGRPVVISRQDPRFHDRVWPVLVEAATAVGAPIVRAWEHNPVLQARPAEGGTAVRVRTPDGQEHEGVLPLRGGFQAANMEAAIAAVWYMARATGRTPTGAELLRGLSLVRWPGRMEVHRGRRGELLVLDGAHCPLSARAAGGALRELLAAAPGGERRFVLLFGMQEDKDHAGFLRELAAACAPLVPEAIVCYRVPGPRGAAPDKLVESAQSAGFQAIAAPALDEALSMATDIGLPVLAAGTLYTLADFRQLWLDR